MPSRYCDGGLRLCGVLDCWRKLPMNKTVAFVSLFLNEDPKTKAKTLGASFHLGDIDVGASHLPEFDIDAMFKPTVSKKGVKYLVSKRPLLIEFSDVTPGKTAGRYFTNIISLVERPEMGISKALAMLNGETPKQDETQEPTDAPENEEAF